MAITGKAKTALKANTVLLKPPISAIRVNSG